MKSLNSLLLLLLAGTSLAFQRPALVAHKSALFTTSGGGAVSTPEASAVPATKKSAVIVGGGPVGLATALTLSNAPHYYDITLVEQSPETSGYDPTKAYLYLVNPRGQVWTKRFPRVQELLEERGSMNTGMGNFVTVPGDPSEPVPDKLPAKDGEPSYWIPRHGMVTLLEDAIAEQEEKRLASSDDSGGVGSIQVLPCKACLSLEPQENGQIEVTVQDTKDPEVRFEQSFVADLVVGADGMNSAVRNILSHPPPAKKINWLTEHSKKFQTHSWASAASGLRMKVLQFPPGFIIPPSNIPTESETIYAIRSINKGPTNYISLGLLPVRDPNFVRPTNVITRPNHDMWKLKGDGGSAIKTWFQTAFPRLNLDDMIDDAEWERFASAQGTTFPKCQYCSGMQVTAPHNANTGVVLVGDAIHAFPPDIGQGINAGLADVEALDRALKGKDIITGAGDETTTPPSSLAAALEAYEKVRAPEVKSLIRLARFGSPYQYRQPMYRDRVGRTLWTMNVALRMLLNKISGGVLAQPAIVNAMDKSVTYHQLMRRADMTTAVLYSVAALILRQVGGMPAVAIGGAVATALWFITFWFGR